MSKKNIKPQYIFEAQRFYDFFRAALIDVLKHNQDGVNATLIAQNTGISTSSISCIIHDDPARRLYPSFQMQVAIARYLGYDYINFLAKGRALVVNVPILDKMALRLNRFTDITREILSQDGAQSTALRVVLNSLYRDMEFAKYRQVSGLIGKNDVGGGVTDDINQPNINLITNRGR